MVAFRRHGPRWRQPGTAYAGLQALGRKSCNGGQTLWSVYLTEPGPQQRTAAQHIVEVELFVVRIEQLVAIGIANDAVRPRLMPAHTEVRFGDGVGIEHR